MLANLCLVTYSTINEIVQWWWLGIVIVNIRKFHNLILEVREINWLQKKCVKKKFKLAICKQWADLKIAIMQYPLGLQSNFFYKSSHMLFFI